MAWHSNIRLSFSSLEKTYLLIWYNSVGKIFGRRHGVFWITPKRYLQQQALSFTFRRDTIGWLLFGSVKACFRQIHQTGRKSNPEEFILKNSISSNSSPHKQWVCIHQQNFFIRNRFHVTLRIFSPKILFKQNQKLDINIKYLQITLLSCWQDLQKSRLQLLKLHLNKTKKSSNMHAERMFCENILTIWHHVLLKLLFT